MGARWLRDFRGDGGTFRNKGSLRARCSSCGHLVAVSRMAWSRVTRPTCGCGGLLEPSLAAQKKDPGISCQGEGMGKRRCCLCPTLLNSRNPFAWCSACSRKALLVVSHFSPRKVVEFRGEVEERSGDFFFKGEFKLNRAVPVETGWMRLRSPPEWGSRT